MLKYWLIKLALIVQPFAGVSAQTMYKCAGNYQDRPCETELQQQYSNLTGGFKTDKANPRASPQCAKLGAAVQKVREDLDAGKTVDQVSSELAKKNGDKLFAKKARDVVGDISRMSGTPIQVRYQFEGECADLNIYANSTSDRGRSASISPPSGNIDLDSRLVARDAARAAADAARAAANAARYSR